MCSSDLEVHGLVAVQIVAIPEATEREFLLDHLHHHRVGAGPADGGKPILLLLQNPEKAAIK